MAKGTNGTGDGLARLARELDALVGQWDGGRLAALRAPDGGGVVDDLVPPTTGYGEPRSITAAHIGFLVATNRERIEAVLRDRVAALYVDGDGIGTAARAARLTALRGRLHGLEVAEETQVLAIEAHGGDVDRRGDADPAVVLAVLAAA